MWALNELKKMITSLKLKWNKINQICKLKESVWMCTLNRTVMRERES